MEFQKSTVNVVKPEKSSVKREFEINKTGKDFNTVTGFEMICYDCEVVEASKFLILTQNQLKNQCLRRSDWISGIKSRMRKTEFYPVLREILH